MPATIPNSRSIALLVMEKTAKPTAALILQKRVTTPIFPIISSKAFVLLPVLRNDVWYLFIK